MTMPTHPAARAAALLASLALALAPAAARAIPRPLNPTAAGAAQPKLLSDYERRVLSHELTKLMKEIRVSRAKAAEDESLAPLRDALAAAKAEGVESNVQAAAKALSDAVETKLYEDPEVPAKIKRLQEVGNFLEYDSRLRREQRASSPVVRRAPPVAEPPAVPPDPDPPANGAEKSHAESAKGAEAGGASSPSEPSREGAESGGASSPGGPPEF
jgi:hypothetical protein